MMKATSLELNCDALLKPKAARKRAWEIDFLRGLCILLVVFDHSMFDFMSVIEFSNNYFEVHNLFFETMQDLAYLYWHWEVRLYVRITIVFLFLFLSGISCSFSRSNSDRFFKLAAAASAITLVTVVLESEAGMSGMSIIFGILHVMAFNVLAYMLAETVSRLFIQRIFPKNWQQTARGVFFLLLGGALAFSGLSIPNWTRLPSVPALGKPNVLWPFALISVLFLVYFTQKKLQKNENKRSGKKNRIIKILTPILAGAVFIGVFLILKKNAFGAEELNGYIDLALGKGVFGGDSYGVLPNTGVFLMGVTAGGLLYPQKQSLLPGLNKPLPALVRWLCCGVFGVAVGFFCSKSWVFAILGGTVLGGGAYVLDRFLKRNRPAWHSAFSFVGRNTIWVYLAHQIVVFAALVVAAMAVGYRFF